MGQAKQRKLNDPLYGKFNRPSVRGLIISSPVKIETGSTSFTGGLEPQELRFSLLFWDRLCWPMSIVEPADDRDIKFLQSAGIMHRPDYPIYGKVTDAMIKNRQAIFEKLNDENPGGWAIHQGQNSISVTENTSDEETASLLTLLSLIPIPKRDVPIAEILEFKARRRPELLAFRTYMDNIIYEITSSSDSEASFSHRKQQIETACSDLRAVAKEWQFPVYLSDYSAGFNFDIAKALAAGGAGWKAGDAISPAVGVLGSAIGVVGSQFKLSAATKFRPAKLPASPFKYAYQIQTDL
ncbi:DUF6236 family protein [Pseudomonas baltica]|uniref:DUF6236 family protein n=1 Tax=Pseudomonas baltica TaxID=2762576 RepID=UPI002897AC86|nr:DUF6236 family protein [Pseudomonas baltica]